MPTPNLESTRNTLDELLVRQGGGLFLEQIELLDVDFSTWLSAASVPAKYKPMSISIYDSSQNVDVVTLILMINPKDINIGQTFISSNSYTRVGWVTSLWGRQQMTLALSGSSPGFYFIGTNGSGGLTNYNRVGSAGFSNLMALVGLFKNNAYYFLNYNHATIFRDGTSRVINVMDSIKIDYDGSIYLGSFSTFSMTDAAAMPFRIEYNIEFVVSSIGVDLEPIEGHVKKDDNYKMDDVVIAVQGANVSLNKKFELDENELNKYYEVDEVFEEIKVSGFLRGGGEEGVYKSSNVLSFDTVDTPEFLENSPATVAALNESASFMGLTPEQLSSLITFESAGTWNPYVDNPNSTAIGIGQWTDAAAQSMAKVLARQGLIKSSSQIKTSQDLVNFFNTTDQQVSLFPIYCQATKVSKNKTLYQALQEQTNPEDRFDTYMIGHFYPAYVGKGLDTPFPENVQKVNPGIRTPRDYLRKVRKTMSKMNNMNRKRLDIVESPVQENTESD